MKKSSKWITFIALSVTLNIVGSKISLLLSLPIFLDSIGTIMAGTVIGPAGGLLTALAGGLVNGAMGDVYAIYFSPSGIIMGLMAGLLLHNKRVTKISLIWRTLLIVAPASAVSSVIEVVLFGGITSAAFTTAVVQVLSNTVMNLFGSAFLVQLLTDYIGK